MPRHSLLLLIVASFVPWSAVHPGEVRRLLHPRRAHRRDAINAAQSRLEWIPEGAPHGDDTVGVLDIIMFKHHQRASIQNHDRAMHRPALRTASLAEVSAWSNLTHYAASQVAKELQQMVAYVAEDVTPSSVGAPPIEVRAFACCNR